MPSSFESPPHEPLSVSTQGDAQSLSNDGVSGKLINFAEEERRHLARELHDDFGQRLSWLAVELDTLRKQLQSQRSLRNSRTALRKRCESALSQVQELAADVHNLAHRLHSVKLQHLGLPAALSDVCRQIARQHQLRIDLHANDGCSSLSEDTALCLYRVAQEALNNAVKHSHSKRLEVNLKYERGRVFLQVRDFGVGFDPVRDAHGLGLATMQERLHLLGGTLSIKSISGGGTELTAEAKTKQSPSEAKAA